MKKFLMLLVAGTLVLSITGCKKKVDEPVPPGKEDIGEVGDDAKKDAGKAVDEAAAKAKKALK